MNSVEAQNEANRVRQLLHMKMMMKLMKDKRSFYRYINGLGKVQRLRLLGR